MIPMQSPKGGGGGKGGRNDRNEGICHHGELLSLKRVTKQGKKKKGKFEPSMGSPCVTIEGGRNDPGF